MMRTTVALLASFLLPATVTSLDNGLALTPPMGWRCVKTYGSHALQLLLIMYSHASSISGFSARMPMPRTFSSLHRQRHFQSSRTDCRRSSWNFFQGAIDSAKIKGQVDAMLVKRPTQGGAPKSLLDLGYTHVRRLRPFPPLPSPLRRRRSVAAAANAAAAAAAAAVASVCCCWCCC